MMAKRSKKIWWEFVELSVGCLDNFRVLVNQSFRVSKQKTRMKTHPGLRRLPDLRRRLFDLLEGKFVSVDGDDHVAILEIVVVTE